MSSSILAYDLHLHAGNERFGRTLEEYTAAVAARGVTLCGLLDHVELHLPENAWGRDFHHQCAHHQRPCYPFGMEGLKAMYAEFAGAPRPPGMKFLHGLEFNDPGPATPEEALALPDYVCFCFGDVTQLPGATFGARAAQRIHQIGRKVRPTGKPGIINHPFRNRLFGFKEQLQQGVTPDIDSFISRNDVARMIDAAADYALALEVNQNDILIAHELGDGPMVDLFARAVGLLVELGARMSFGSDMHHPQPEYPACVPAFVQRVGLTAENIAPLVNQLAPQAR